MGAKSSIEWTEATWNPIAGCAHVSPGCDNCYAARESAGRLKNHAAYVGLTVESAKPAHFTGQIRLLPERLDQPLRWREPRRIFVNSMSDLFHKDVSDEFIAGVFAVMAACQRHTFQVLTKRPQRMAQLLASVPFADLYANAMCALVPHRSLDLPVFGQWPLPNVWLGTSIENDTYTFRADHLRATPAAVRFVSAEPLLGPLPSLDLAGIDWLIVGGESGPDARPMHPDWVRDLRDRCDLLHGYCDDGLGDECWDEAPHRGPAFFFKQWGEWAPAITFDEDRHAGIRVGKQKAGRMLDGRTWDEYPLPREVAA